jgi:hypothetical protein
MVATGQGLELLVVRVGQQVAVEVPDEMDETLLLVAG